QDEIIDAQRRMCIRRVVRILRLSTIDPQFSARRFPVSTRLRRFERRTASARTRRVWIDDSKTGARQTVGEIQGRAPQVGDTFVLYKKLHPIALDYCIAFFSFAKCHLVMQT